MFLINSDEQLIYSHKNKIFTFENINGVKSYFHDVNIKAYLVLSKDGKVYIIRILETIIYNQIKIPFLVEEIYSTNMEYLMFVFKSVNQDYYKVKLCEEDFKMFEDEGEKYLYYNSSNFRFKLKIPQDAIQLNLTNNINFKDSSGKWWQFSKKHHFGWVEEDYQIFFPLEIPDNCNIIDGYSYNLLHNGKNTKSARSACFEK